MKNFVVDYSYKASWDLPVSGKYFFSTEEAAKKFIDVLKKTRKSATIIFYCTY